MGSSRDPTYPAREPPVADDRLTDYLNKFSADRVAMLFNGAIIEQGTPDEFQRSPNPMVQQFIEGRAQGPLTE